MSRICNKGIPDKTAILDNFYHGPFVDIKTPHLLNTGTNLNQIHTEQREVLLYYSDRAIIANRPDNIVKDLKKNVCL